MDVHPVETSPSRGEGAQIFDHLKAGKRPGREAHSTTWLFRTVQPLAMATCPHGHHPGVLLDDSHQLLERALIQDRIGVERDEVRRGRGIDAGIQGVGLAAVLLVDDDQPHDRAGRGWWPVHGPNRGGADRRPVGHLGPAQPEGPLEPLERSVGEPSFTTTISNRG